MRRSCIACLMKSSGVYYVDEESGLVYGPFKHAFKCIAKYVSAAWKIRNAYAHPSDVA